MIQKSVVHKQLHPCATSTKRRVIEAFRLGGTHFASLGLRHTSTSLASQGATICEHYLTQSEKILLRDGLQHPSHNGDEIERRLVARERCNDGRQPWSFDTTVTARTWECSAHWLFFEHSMRSLSVLSGDLAKALPRGKRRFRQL